eukprot:15079157-Alexandrium_andersonii.AAC.1
MAVREVPLKKGPFKRHGVHQKLVRGREGPMTTTWMAGGLSRALRHLARPAPGASKWAELT